MKLPGDQPARSAAAKGNVPEAQAGVALLGVGALQELAPHIARVAGVVASQHLPRKTQVHLVPWGQPCLFILEWSAPVCTEAGWCTHDRSAPATRDAHAVCPAPPIKLLRPSVRSGQRGLALQGWPCVGQA